LSRSQRIGQALAEIPKRGCFLLGLQEQLFYGVGLALMIAGIFGLLALSAPRAANLESIARIVDPFAMQQLHRA
jgi:hypothetical protein